MTTMAMIPSLSSPFDQVSHQGLEDRPKRQGAKNVSWATEDKLCQVRLFAAEDAPSLSGTVLQDLLQAKKTRFMHAVTPVSADDLPPGFEGVAAKRAKYDAVAVLVMVAQISWQCPEKFVYDPLWQVVAGGESAEITAEQQREVRVLEAVYPRPSAIPSSPAEPQETSLETKDVPIPEIPLIPIEDEDEGIEEECLPGTKAFYSFPSEFKFGSKVSPNQFSDYLLKDSQKLGWGSSASPMISKAGQSNPELSASYFRNADPNVAAAAAAAYAVVKARESGALIDHDLLMKILTNPILIETLTASNHTLKNLSGDSSYASLNREMANGSRLKVNNEQPSEGSYNASGILGSHIKSTTLLVTQGRQKLDSSFEGRNIQGPQGSSRAQAWDSTGGVGNSQGRHLTGAHEQSNGMKGMSGQVKGTFGTTILQSRSFPLRQDHMNELGQQHGTVRSNNEAQIRHGTSVVLDDFKSGHDGERHRATGLGSRGLPWIGNNQNDSSMPSRNDVGAHDRAGNEIPRLKIRKPCLYFNTPRGCRNGMSCNFLHDTGTEKPYAERTRTDTPQLQQVKKFRVDTADNDRGSTL